MLQAIVINGLNNILQKNSLMKKQVLFLLSFIGILLAISACNKKTSITPNTINPQKLQINQNIEALSSRITYSSEAVIFSKNANGLQYTMVANIDPITINGNRLSASAITSDDQYMYICYHTKGEAIGGEILTVDVSDVNEPSILQSATSTQLDFNNLSLSTNRSKLWLCGDELVNNWGKAFAMELTLNENIPAENASWFKSLDAYSGNSITGTSKNGNDYLWITSGSNGGLQVFNQNEISEESFSFEANNCKQFSAERYYGVMVFGVNTNLSVVRVFDLNNPFSYTDYEIPYDVSHLGKNGIAIYRRTAYLAMGEDGLIEFDLTHGVIKSIFKSDKGAYANAAFVLKDYIYLAYGQAGLYILDRGSMSSLGNWDFDGSCNDVVADRNHVYIANGDGDGFIILSKN